MTEEMFDDNTEEVKVPFEELFNLSPAMGLTDAAIPTINITPLKDFHFMNERFHRGSHLIGVTKIVDIPIDDLKGKLIVGLRSKGSEYINFHSFEDVPQED